MIYFLLETCYSIEGFVIETLCQTPLILKISSKEGFQDIRNKKHQRGRQLSQPSRRKKGAPKRNAHHHRRLWQGRNDPD